MNKYKSILLIIILLNFISVCATNGNKGSRKSRTTLVATKTTSPQKTEAPGGGGGSPPETPGGNGGGGSPPETPGGGGGGPPAPGGGGGSPPETPGGGGGGPPAPGGGGGSPPETPGGGGGGPPAPGGGESPPTGGPGGGGGGNPPETPGGGGGGPPAPGGGGSPPAGGPAPPGGGPPAPAPPSGGSPPAGTPEAGETVLAYVLFSETPSTTTTGRPQIKGLISLYQPPSGNTTVTGNIGVTLSKVDGNYKFTIKDDGGVILYDFTRFVIPLFIGQASLFSFTWDGIKLTGPGSAMGKHFVVEESGGTLVDGLIKTEYDLK